MLETPVLSPRPYQVQLYDIAKEKNVIAYLQTGAGKTLQVSQFSNISLQENTSKKKVFLVPSVPLVSQQSQKIRENTSLNVQEYSADSLKLQDGIDEACQVIVSTPLIFLNILRHAIITMSQIDLLIVDECHHCTRNHPYNLIMGEFYHPAIEKPKVFGMTASPIYQNTTTHSDHVDSLIQLQNNLDCVIITINDQSKLNGYYATAKELFLEFHVNNVIPSAITLKYYNHFRAMLSDKFGRAGQKLLLEKDAKAAKMLSEYVKSLRNLLSVLDHSIVDLGYYCAANIAADFAFDRYFSEDFTIQQVEQQPSQQATYKIPDLTDIRNNDMSPKLNALLTIIREKSLAAVGDEFRCIVFVERRTTAAAISNVINNLSPLLFPKIKAGFVTGNNTRGRIHKASKEGENKGIFNSFRYGDINLIVATRVAEEGVDIPACRLVVLYDLFRSNTGYVQSRGRARHIGGAEYYILVQRDDYTSLKYIAKAKMAELVTKNVASGSILADALQITKGRLDDEVVDNLLGYGGSLQCDQVVSRIGAKATILGCNDIVTRYLSPYMKRVNRRLKLQYPADSRSASWGKNGNDLLVIPIIEMKVGSMPKLAWPDYLSCLSLQQNLIDRPQIVGEDCSNLPTNPKVKQPGDFGISVCILLPIPRKLNNISQLLTQHSHIPTDVANRLRHLHDSNSFNFIPVYGNMRLTQKLAVRSASLYAIQLLYSIGAINDHFFPIRRDIDDTMSYTNAIIWNTVKNTPLNPTPALAGNDGAIDMKQNCIKVPNKPKLPKVFCDPVEEGIFSESNLYVTILNLGPEFDRYAKANEVELLRALIEGDDAEPLRRFAILTKSPIPVRDIPPISTYLGIVPCKVELLSYCYSSPPIGYNNVNLPTTTRPMEELIINDDDDSDMDSWMSDDEKVGSENRNSHAEYSSPDRRPPSHVYKPVLFEKAQAEKIGAFQVAFWEMCRTSQQDLQPGEAISYKILPMLGRTVRKISEEHIVNGLVDWKFDWGMVDLVVQGQSLPLDHWMKGMESLVTGCLGETGGKRKRAALSHSTAGSLFDELFANISEPGHTAILNEGRVGGEEAVRARVQDACRQAIVVTTYKNILYTVDGVEFEMTPGNTMSCNQKPNNGGLEVSFVDYLKAKHDIDVINRQSPMISARLTNGLFSNMLLPYESEVEDRSKVYLVPEVCIVLPFPVQVFHLAQIFPSILWRVQQFALIDEFRRGLDLLPLKCETLFEAFSTPMAMNLVDYERLETLGDSFLKYAVTQDVFRNQPQSDEGIMTQARSELVSNKKLCEIALERQWELLQFRKPFDASKWHPNGLVSPLSEAITDTQSVSRKTIADFVEAIIGACYVCGGDDVAMQFLAKIGLVSQRSSEELLSDQPLANLLTLGKCALSNFTKAEIKIPPSFPLDEIQHLISYDFENPMLLLEAFTHASFSPNFNYQRLEFLGDSLVDWVTSRFIFDSNHSLTPGDLSIIRQVIVSNESLGRLSLKLGLDKVVRHNQPSLDKQIQSFVSYLEENDEDTFRTYTFDCPKILGDLFESLAGAIYVDSGSVQVLWTVLNPIMYDFMKRCADPLVVAKSPIRLYLEIFQKFRFDTKNDLHFAYTKTVAQMTECRIILKPENVVIAKGLGSSSHAAKRQACIYGLREIEGGDVKLKFLSDARLSPKYA